MHVPYVSQQAQKQSNTMEAISGGDSARVQLKESLRGQSFAEQTAALSPVQCKGGDNAPGVQAAAAQGITGGGGTLPYADKIQAAFGRHDISNIQAYQGGNAAGACDAIGAEAYATGSSVAFKGAPTLHTAAHEAAHIVQQRGGVSLKGGVGKAGDAYEQHADAVADLVVQGKSAESLLDTMAGNTPSNAGPGAIQKQEANSDQAPAPASLDNALINRLNGISRTIGQQHDSNCEAIKTAIRSFERFIDVDAIPGSAAEGFWTGAIGKGIEVLVGMIPGGKLYSVFRAGYRASSSASSNLSRWNGALAKTEYVQGLVDYWESFRVEMETYWNGEGSQGTQALIRQTAAEPEATQNAYVTELVELAELFNTTDVDSVAVEQGLYTQWMGHNTRGTSRFSNTGTIEVTYDLNKNDRSFSLSSATLVGPGSGGILRRMQALGGDMTHVDDFPFRKRVRFKEYEPGFLGRGAPVRASASVYGEQNELVDALTFGPVLGQWPEYGINSLGVLPLTWSQISASS